MILNMLKGKIHRAAITDANLDYEGSIAIDSELMDLIGLLPYEQVDVYNITNGERLTTYAIPAKAGGHDICLNGAAAHKGNVGDRIIICTYIQLDAALARWHTPKIALVDEHNRLVEAKEVKLDDRVTA